MVVKDSEGVPGGRKHLPMARHSRKNQQATWEHFLRAKLFTKPLFCVDISFESDPGQNKLAPLIQIDMSHTLAGRRADMGMDKSPCLSEAIELKQAGALTILGTLHFSKH